MFMRFEAGKYGGKTNVLRLLSQEVGRCGGYPRWIPRRRGTGAFSRGKLLRGLGSAEKRRFMNDLGYRPAVPAVRPGSGPGQPRVGFGVLVDGVVGDDFGIRQPAVLAVLEFRQPQGAVGYGQLVG